MNKRKLPKSLLLSFVFVVCVLVSFMPNFTAKAQSSQQEVDEFYYEYRLKPSLLRIDPDERFVFFYNAYPSGGEDYFILMQDMVEIANYLDGVINSFSRYDYDAYEWGEIEKRIDRLISDSKIKTNFLKQEYLDRISNERAKILLDYNTKAQKFEKSRVLALDEIQEKYDIICKKSLGDDIVYQKIGYYDSVAKQKADELYALYTQKIEDIVFTNEDEILLKNELSGLKVESLRRFGEIDKNKIERAYSKVMDYYALINFMISGNRKQTLDEATALCREVIDDYLPILPDEVYAEYSDEIDLIKNFLNRGYSESAYKKQYTNEITSEDKVVTIVASYLSGSSQQAFDVFLETDTLIVHNTLSGASRQNAQNVLNKIDNGISVAYFAYIDVYRGTNLVKPVSVTDSGDPVIYRVSIDLNKYYENYVLKDNPMADKFFKDNTALKKWLIGENRCKNICDIQDYVKKTGNNDISACYNYYVQDGESVLLPLNFNIDTNGGILMFETNNLSTFAIVQKGSENLLLNPLFWLILIFAIIVVIVAVVVILRNLTYTYKFYLNNDNKVVTVKVKKGDVFALPDSPEKDGFVFGGWFIDKKCSVRFVETRLGQRHSKKVYAKWTESDIPYKYKKYYEALRQEMLKYSKVGPLAEMGTSEREILAKLFADMDGVYLYTAVSTEKVKSQGFDVTQEKGEYALTPTKKTITDKASFNEAMRLITYVMAQKGLQDVGIDIDELAPISEKERKEGFVFVIENDKVAYTLEDYFNLLRVYMKSFVLRNPSSSIQEGAFLTRMYLGKDNISLYLALAPVGDGVINASDKFSDTPALVKVGVSVQDIERAYDLIDKVMMSNGFERENENANNLILAKPIEGNGVASIVKLENTYMTPTVLDCFNELRAYLKSFVLTEQNDNAKQGECLARMIYNGNSISIYFALEPDTIGVIDASQKFSDTPALVRIGTNLKGVDSAYELIDKVMQSKGFVRSAKENANSLEPVQVGNGVMFTVKFSE